MSSYAAARIHVMRSRLIGAEQYERLMKMQEKEIIGWLQGTDYREDVDRLAIKDLEDLEAVDRVIAHNHDRTVRKLERISGKAFRATLRPTLRENDAWNLKIIAEAIAGGEDAAQALRAYARKGTFDPTPLAAAKSVGELSRLAHVGPAEDLPRFLDALPMPEDAHARIIDVQNIGTLVRLKRDGLAADRIMARMRKGTLPRSVLRAAAEAPDATQALERLRPTAYGTAIGRADGALARLEGELHQDVLRRIRRDARTYPLGIDLLLRYMAEKELEHANLRVLIKGKRLGLGEAFIREHLVA